MAEATQTTGDNSAAKGAKQAPSIAELAKAFERDGTMEPGYTYQYRPTIDGNAELVVSKRG